MRLRETILELIFWVIVNSTLKFTLASSPLSQRSSVQQCRHCTLRTYVSRTSIIVLCWIRSIDCIGQDQLESSHSTFWIRFWIAQLDHDWIPRLIYDGHQLVSLLYSPHLFEGSWSLIWYQRFTHFLKTHPWLVLKRKNIKSLEKTFFSN